MLFVSARADAQLPHHELTGKTGEPDGSRNNAVTERAVT